jgi:response regulator RpfG family c-di-GMP phosphodiesterase
MSGNIDALLMSLVWLDSSTNNPEEHIATEQQLRLLDTNLKTCNDEKECEDYLKSQPENAHIVLIANGKLGQQLVPKIHNLPQIVSIYVYCLNKKAHEQWVTEFTKVFIWMIVILSNREID